MIADTSAILAVIKAEPGWDDIDRLLSQSRAPRMSAGTHLELGIVIDRVGDPSLSRRLDHLLDHWGVIVDPVTPAQARIARAAYRDFGRGSGHRAGLNFGDAFSYALASDTGEPLLFVGDDFTHTDLFLAQR